MKNLLGSKGFSPTLAAIDPIEKETYDLMIIATAPASCAAFQGTNFASMSSKTTIFPLAFKKGEHAHPEILIGTK